jgi:DNA-binding NarL/FixJ family response regulator
MHQKLILADDYTMYRTGMARILAVEDTFRIVAQADTFASLRRSVVSFPSATVIFSASVLPQPDALTHALQGARSRGIVVIENSEIPQSYLNHVTFGVVYRKINAEEFVSCVRRVSRGDTYVQQMSKETSALVESHAFGERLRECLTPKELIVLSFVIRGQKNKLIATELKTSEQVIKNLLSSIFSKTETSDRLELALFTLHNRTLAQAAAAAGRRDRNYQPG